MNQQLFTYGYNLQKQSSTSMLPNILRYVVRPAITATGIGGGLLGGGYLAGKGIEKGVEKFSPSSWGPTMASSAINALLLASGGYGIYRLMKNMQAKEEEKKKLSMKV